MSGLTLGPAGPEVVSRWADDDGHAWPITGQWCDGCGLPLIRVTADQARHPLCEPEGDA